jgi:ribonuclease HII
MPTITPNLVAGIDEVGLGAWAGPIVSVVAVFHNDDLRHMPKGTTDSKKLDDNRRRALYLPLCQLAHDVGIGHAWPWEVDELGMTPALQLSYARALRDLRCLPHLLIVDGEHKVAAWKSEQIVEPKADLNHQQVSAASVIAKHFRDTMMIDYGKQFPSYNWAENKGYGTPDHERAIHQYGLLIDPSDHSRYMHRRRYTRKVMLRKPECLT